MFQTEMDNIEYGVDADSALRSRDALRRIRQGAVDLNGDFQHCNECKVGYVVFIDQNS